MQHKKNTGRVVLGEDTATFYRHGVSSPDVAKILGRETTQEAETIYLDRRVHFDDGAEFSDGWIAAGAFVTQLTRPLQNLAQL
ncbi:MULTISPECIES: hypothetical protein [unclassified Dyella]|uniref:hypothetical protein n=1 Tax=Dyella sp. ASV21 TaxID=2795114 RepID=UPI0018EA85FF|nr:MULTISPECIES: hypothetical protein [unclassified Dyella]